MFNNLSSKKIIVLILLSLCSQFVIAQPETLVTSTNFIQRLLKLNNILYYTTGGGVYYIDINDTNYTPQFLVSLNPAGMIHKNGFLYVSDFGNNKIIKIDLSQSAVNPIDVVSTPNGAVDLLFIGDFLYYSSAISNNIYRYNINGTNQTPESVVTTASFPTGLEHKDGILYFSIAILDTIYSFDLNTPNATVDVVLENEANMDSPLNIEFYDNQLYAANWFSDNILKINIDNSPINSEIVLNQDGVYDVELDQGELYYCNLTTIYRVNLSSLSVNDVTLKTIQLYPNPANNELQVSNLNTKKVFEIYTTLGKQIKKGEIEPDGIINISYLKTGLYFIKIENEDQILKFLKI